jgi:N-acetylmuramic acid 6-phosphate etherase
MSNRARAMAVTEKRNPASRGLDRLSAVEILRRMNREDARVATAIRKEISAIGHAVNAIVRGIQSGGRLIYCGAGTGGRLAVMDAAECPPTFGVSPKIVQAVIAGGERALRHAVEGAEDDAAQGARDMTALRINSRDVVVGLAASGATPYVLGAIRCAKKRGAVTVAITANPQSALARLARIAIVPRTGPEMLAGSTRLKAGTAQKMVLNMLSTAAMVRLGHVYENWMIDVAPSNKKLRRRTLRILEEAAGVKPAAAARALRESGGEAPAALVMLKLGVTPVEARGRLKAAGGNLRKALGENDA